MAGFYFKREFLAIEYGSNLIRQDIFINYEVGDFSITKTTLSLYVDDFNEF